MYSEDVVNILLEYLKEEEWRYDYDSEKGIIETGLLLGEKIKSCELHIIIKKDYLINYGTIDIYADDKNRILVSEFLTRANFGLTWGNFELDFSDGEIRYKTALDLEGIKPTKEMIERMLLTPARMFKFYSDGLIKVLFGFSTPKDAVEECELNEETE